MSVFHGLSAFPLTPADARGRVDIEALARLVERLAAAKADSIGLLGSTGTYAYLSRDERRRALEAAVECLAKRVPLIVGVGALRTDAAEDLARDAEAAGADALLLAPMTYTPLTEDEVFAHFSTVAAATALPLCIYNNPGTTHFTFSAALLARLSNVPNIKGVKLPLPADGDFTGELQRLRSATPEDFAIGYSGDWGAAPALLAGADCWYSVVAGLLPGPALRLTRAAEAGNEAEVQRMDESFRPLWVLFKEFGSLRVMYAVAKILGLTNAKPPRPILSVGDVHLPRVEKALVGLRTRS